MQYLRNRPKTESTTALRPRCGVPCPLCNCPCDQPANHDASVTKHRTCHQPSAFSGMKHASSGKLVSQHCPCQFASTDQFKVDGMTDFRPWREYCQQFPEWGQPVESQPLKLREYIMFKYNKELADYWGNEPADDIPSSYNRNLHDIKTELSNFIKTWSLKRKLMHSEEVRCSRSRSSKH